MYGLVLTDGRPQQMSQISSSVKGILAGATVVLFAGVALAKRRAKRGLELHAASLNDESMRISLSKNAVDASELIFIGSGSSTGCPRPMCLMDTAVDCKVCKDAARGPGISRNWRGNPSLLIRVRQEDGSLKHVQIDVGKTFTASALHWFPRCGVPGLDAVVLTHGHADAMLGLDDLRGFQQFRFIDAMTTGADPIPIYLCEKTFAVVRQIFSYLVAPSTSEIKRKVAQLTYHMIKHGEPMNIAGLEITPVSVKHGEDQEAMGFVFGSTHRVVYLSDVSRIPDDVMDILRAAPIDLFIVDCCFKTKDIKVHFNLRDALGAIRALKPKKSLLIGMTDEFDYYVDNADIRRRMQAEGLDVEMAFDGLRISLDL